MNEQLIQIKENLRECQELADYSRTKAYYTIKNLGLLDDSEVTNEEIKSDPGFIPEINFSIGKILEELNYVKKYVTKISDTFEPAPKGKVPE